MKQKTTAGETLAQIENRYFKGIPLAEATTLEGAERRAFVLSQVERLLREGSAYCPMAMALSDEFWTADEGRIPMPWEETAVIPEPGYRTNPLLSLKERQTLSRDEMGRVGVIVEVTGLCHDLSLHFPFDLNEAFGIRGNLWVSNKRLVEWLSTTPYEHIAMHTAYILKRHANSTYFDMQYQPAQDATAEIFSREYRELIREPYGTEMPPRAYVKTILDELHRIERHWQRGRRLKLNPEVVKLHDDIYGMMPRQFDKGVMEAAQELYDYMDKNVRGRLHYNGPFVSWDKLPKSYRSRYDDVMRRFIEKVHEVRAKHLGKGWLTDRSLAFGYVLAQAEFIGGYMTSEENNAL